MLATSLATGKSVYFWALVSALGTFWLGAGVSMRHSIEELINPTVALDKVRGCGGIFRRVNFHLLRYTSIWGWKGNSSSAVYGMLRRNRVVGVRLLPNIVGVSCRCWCVAVGKAVLPRHHAVPSYPAIVGC